MSIYEQMTNNTLVHTENGALGFATTKNSLLDLNYEVPSLRVASEKDISEKFRKALDDYGWTAVVWLFFARDIRGGMGERRLFRACFPVIVDKYPEQANQLLKQIQEYGRWDDLFSLVDTPLENKAIRLMQKQIAKDVIDMKQDRPISLLAKWLPSPNTSSKKTRDLAKKVYRVWGITERQYRQTLSKLRNYLDVVERSMSAKHWGDIKYEAVPSKANLLYKEAFLRNDRERRIEYLAKLEKGEVKINSSTAYPYEIVHKYASDWYILRELDPVLEGMWKNLPDSFTEGNCMVVADGSGSMFSPVGSGSATAWSVAHSLAIYFSERMKGELRNKYITFSGHPEFVNFPEEATLREKLRIAQRHSECANTNVEAVFDLLLSTAIREGLQQADLPETVLIISDMEFDSCTYCNSSRYGISNVSKTLFESIAEKWAQYGFKLPRLVFWNVNSRTNAIPVRENEMGVALVSGFSQNVADMVMSGKLDPFEALLDTLHKDRYAPLWAIQP